MAVVKLAHYMAVALRAQYGEVKGKVESPRLDKAAVP
jgi:hypothetical protein